jgi:hypothetical protein
MAVAFDIDGSLGALPEGTAELIAENLHNFSLGSSHRYYKDVELLVGAGIDPAWTHGAKAMADIIEDALIGLYDRPIPLDPRGKAAAALMRALSLTGPASWDATSEHAQLLNALREAGTQ